MIIRIIKPGRLAQQYDHSLKTITRWENFQQLRFVWSPPWPYDVILKNARQTWLKSEVPVVVWEHTVCILDTSTLCWFYSRCTSHGDKYREMMNSVNHNVTDSMKIQLLFFIGSTAIWTYISNCSRGYSALHLWMIALLCQKSLDTVTMTSQSFWFSWYQNYHGILNYLQQCSWNDDFWLMSKLQEAF